MEYVAADALLTPFPTGSFGGIIAGGELINHVDGDKLLAEVSRLLQPYGRALLSVGMKWCLDSMYAVADAFTEAVARSGAVADSATVAFNARNKAETESRSMSLRVAITRA